MNPANPRDKCSKSWIREDGRPMTAVEIGQLVAETLGGQTAEGEDPYLDPPGLDGSVVGRPGF